MDMGKKSDEKVAIVTGGSKGIGRAISVQLADNGYFILLNYRSDEKGGFETLRMIRDSGSDGEAMKFDVSDPIETKRAVDEVSSRFDRIEVLVNNAGILRSTRIDNITKAEWDLVLNVNLNSAFLCTKAVLPIMKEKRFGRIVNISSSAGRSVSTLGGAHYTTSKAGMLGFTRAVAKEVAPFGITVNAVCPGLIDTEMVRLDIDPDIVADYEKSFPIPRLGTPEEVAKLVLFLIADAPYITGGSIDINGGDLMM